MGKGPSTQYHKQMADGYIVGTLTCLSPEFIREHASPDFPLVLNIEPTNACNLKCVLCAGQQKARRAKGFMEFGMFKDIIDQCGEQRPLRMLNLHKDGEPLLHPMIIEMIRYAKKSKCAQTIHLNTNGVSMPLKELLQSGLDDLTVSIDAMTARTFERIKGKPLFSKVVWNVLEMVKLRNELKLSTPRIRVKIMEYSQNANEVADFVDFWKEKVDDVQVTGIHDWSGAIEGLQVTDEHPADGKRWPCVLLWYALAVNWDGRVSICNLDWDLSGTVGNVRCESLADIWKSERMKAIRRAALAGQYRTPRICEKCIVWAGGEDMTEWLKEQKEYL